MSLRVIFLGTAGSVPTPKRSLPAILVQRKGEQILFDCGEAVQRQMIKAKTGFHKKMKIFISHMHGDHIMGLPGLMQTMSLMGRDEPLQIYGSTGVKRFYEAIRETVQFNLTFPVEIQEIEKPGVICKEEEYQVQALWSDHVSYGLAYSLVENKRPGKFHPKKARGLGIPEGALWSELQQGRIIKLSTGESIRPQQVLGPPRPGRKVVYSGDTRPFEGMVEFSVDADLLIHDSTLADDLAEKAKKEGHSTPSQAAKIAKRANVKRLVLTHISARYRDADLLLKQAQQIFKDTKLAKDFDEIEIPLSES